MIIYFLNYWINQLPNNFSFDLTTIIYETLSNDWAYLFRVLQLAKALWPISSREEMGTKLLPTSRGGPSLTGILISSYLVLLIRSMELGKAIFTPATKAASKIGQSKSFFFPNKLSLPYLKKNNWTELSLTRWLPSFCCWIVNMRISLYSCSSMFQDR